MGESLKIQVIVDGAQVSAGMNSVTSTVEDATARIKAAFGSVDKAPEGIRNALFVLQNQAKMSAAAVTEATAAVVTLGGAAKQSAPAVNEAKAALQEVEPAANRAAAGVNNARAAFMGLNRELGLGGNRALSTFISQSETLGPILSKAFTGIAIAGFVQLAILAADKISALIDDTFIFTAAQKALYAEEVGANQAILAANEAHAKALREIALIGLPILQQEKLRAQYAKEDAAGLAGTISQQEKALALAQQQLAALKAKKDADTGPQVTGDLAAPVQGEDFDAEIEKQEAAIESLNAKIGVLRAQYVAAGDAVTEANKKLKAEGNKEGDKALERSIRATEEYIARLERLTEQQQRSADAARDLAREQAEFGAKEGAKDSGDETKDLGERQAADREFRQERLNDQKQAALAEIEIQQDNVKEMARLGKLTATQEASQLAALSAQKLAIETQYLDARINTILARLTSDDAKAYAEDLKAWSKLLSDKLKAQQQFQKETQKTNDQEMTSWQKSVSQAMKVVSNDMASGVVAWMDHQRTFGRAAQEVWTKFADTVVSSLIHVGVQMITNAALGKALTDSTKLSDAAAAARHTWAAVSAIPMVGPFLAPEAAAAAFAGVMAFEKGGMVPGRGPVPAIVHGGEQILTPAQQRERNGAGHTFVQHFHVNAGGDDFSGKLAKSGKDMVKLVKRELRKMNL
jgi:hypothetical protein